MPTGSRERDKNMKRILSFFLVAVLLLSAFTLFSCNDDNTDSTTTTSATVEEVDRSVAFETMLHYMVDIADTETGKRLINEQTKADLTELSTSLEGFKDQMNSTVNQEEFREFGHEKFGDGIWINPACDIIFAVASEGGDTARIVDILRLVDKVSFIVPAEFQRYIKNYTYVYDTVGKPCEYYEFLPLLSKVVLALAGEERPIYATDDEVKEVYDIYFANNGGIPQ